MIEDWTGSYNATYYTKLTGAYSGNGTTGPTLVTPSYPLSRHREVPGSRPYGWVKRRWRLHQCTTTSLYATEESYSAVPTTSSHRETYVISGKTYNAYRQNWGDGLIRLVTNQSQDTPPTTASISYTEADNQAKSYLLQRIREAVGEFQTIPFSLELLKTIRTIVRPGRALRDGLDRWNKTARQRVVNAVRSKNGWRVPRYKRRAAIEKTLADSWLEWTFGIKPIVYDLDDAARALAEMNTQTMEWAKPVSSHGDTSSRTYSRTNSFSYQSHNYGWKVYKYSNASVRYRGMVVIKPSRIQRLQQIGLTFDRWAPGIWEVLPYSWAADYFLNLQDVIEGLCTNVSDLAWVQRTVVVEGKATCESPTHSVSTPATKYDVQFSPGYVEWSRRSVTRNQYFGSLTPSLQFRIPGVSTQWANIAAVVAGGKATQRLIARLLS